VTPDQVERNAAKPDWVVVDCRALADYAKGHIPGAISLGKRCKKALRDPTSRVFTDTAKYERMLGKAGIGNNTNVVFYYGDIKTITDATVGFWVMEYLGHDKVYFMDGGIDAWRNAGKRLDKRPVKKSPATFKAKVVKSRLATTAEVLDISQGKASGTQLIDSRTKKEYVGKDIRAIKGGHVPHAVNVDHLSTLKKVKDKKTGKMKAVGYLDADAAAKQFAFLDKNKRAVAYCQTGTRSTLTYLQFRLLGFKNPANWDESWRVWGSDFASDYPIEAPNGAQYYNFAKTNKSIKKLEKNVKALEAALKKLGGGK
jgi:thiosulfate/3-mercaptopyruvate sulfurtransferase